MPTGIHKYIGTTSGTTISTNTVWTTYERLMGVKTKNKSPLDTLLHILRVYKLNHNNKEPEAIVVTQETYNAYKNILKDESPQVQGTQLFFRGIPVITKEMAQELQQQKQEEELRVEALKKRFRPEYQWTTNLSEGIESFADPRNFLEANGVNLPPEPDVEGTLEDIARYAAMVQPSAARPIRTNRIASGIQALVDAGAGLPTNQPRRRGRLG